MNYINDNELLGILILYFLVELTGVIGKILKGTCSNLNFIGMEKKAHYIRMGNLTK